MLNNDREIRNAASTSQFTGSEYPAKACPIVSPPKTLDATTAINTNAPPRIGCQIMPATVAAKIAKIRQPSTVTFSGRGATSAINK